MQARSRPAFKNVMRDTTLGELDRGVSSSPRVLGEVSRVESQPPSLGIFWDFFVRHVNASLKYADVIIYINCLFGGFRLLF